VKSWSKCFLGQSIIENFDIGKTFYVAKILSVKIFLPPKWYTDRNFFGHGGKEGGGEVAEKNVEKNFFTDEKVGHFH
jgi:hypothetical protein